MFAVLAGAGLFAINAAAGAGSPVIPEPAAAGMETPAVPAPSTVGTESYCPPGPQADPHAAVCDSGFARLARGDIEGARELFDSVLRQSQRYPRALLGMGWALVESRGGGERAIDLLRQATELLPLDPAAHYWRARAHMKLAYTDLGTDNARFAERSLRNVLDLDPSHGDAHYQMGLVQRDFLRDLPRAIQEFENQITTNPAHMDARYELLRTLMDTGQWDRAVTAAEAMIARDPMDLRSYPWLAGAHWKTERYADAMAVFERYFAVMGPEEASLYLDLSLVLDTDEMREYERLDPSGQRAFWAHYWRTRDPDPKTGVNERLLEHYIRVAYARLEFGTDVWPWDARGTFYVRYGEPDMRSGRGMPVAWDLVIGDPTWQRKKRDLQEEMGLSTILLETSRFDAPEWDAMGADKGTAVAIADSLAMEHPTWGMFEVWDQAVTMAQNRQFRAGASATPERWVYTDRGIDVTFEDFIGRGVYNVWGPRARQLADQMEHRMPTVSEEEERIDRIDPMDSIVTFRGSEGRTAVDYAFGLLPEEFGAFRSVTGAYATLDVEVDLYTPAWEHVAGAGQAARRLQTIPQVSIRGVPLFVDATRMEVDPGEYRLTILLMDPETGKRATAEEMLDLPDYSGSELMVSDILPAAFIREVGPGHAGTFIRGDLEVLPLPGRALQADQPLFIYYEIYNLARDEFGATQYTIEYAVLEAPEEMAVTARLYHGLRSLTGLRRRRTAVSSTFSSSGIRPDLATYLEVDVSSLAPDTYILELTVTDTVRGERVSNSLVFRTLPPVTAQEIPPRPPGR